MQLVDSLPFAVVLIALWMKLVWASLLLPGEWWSGAGSTHSGIGRAMYALHALMLNPGVGLLTLAALLAVLTPLAVVPRGWRLLGLLLVDIGLTAVAVADLLHVRFYADVLSVRSVLLAPALLQFTPTLVTLLRPQDSLYILDLAAGVALVPVYLRICRRVAPLPLGPRVRLAATAAAVGLALAVPAMRVVWHKGQDLFSPAAIRIDSAATIGILPYHVADAVLSARGRRRVVTVHDRERARRFLAQRHLEPSPLGSIARGRNVIVVSAESLQAFPIGLEVMGQPVAPNLAAFVRESMQFVNIYDQTHLGTTADAEFMSMQSLYPLPTGVVAAGFRENTFRGLPAILAAQGYTTLSACGGPGSFWFMDRMHPRLGFRTSYYEDRYTSGERIGPWLADGDFFRQTVEILAAQSAPFMAFVLSSSNHHPFRLPSHLHLLRLGDLEGTLLGDYLQSVHYFDAAFGDFVSRLRAAELLDRTVIVLYGDHHGFLGDPPELARLLGYAPDDDYRRLLTRKKIPLLIRLPAAQGAGVQRVTGGHVDIAPTLLSLLGVRDDSRVMLGEDLTRGKDSLVVFRDGSFVDGAYHMVREPGTIGGFKCYSVATGHLIDCQPLSARRRAALERLEISDSIIRGDLIPELTKNARATALTAPPAHATPLPGGKEREHSVKR